jgi:lysophospholipase L1-like esterase
MKYLAFFLVAVFILFSIKQIQRDTMPTPSKNGTILAMGDSLTYGYNVPSKDNYPTQLALLSSHKVINAGINGETSEEGLRRLPGLLEDESIEIMVLCLGANDVLQKKSIVALKSNLKKMIHMVKERNIKTLLIPVPNFTLFGLSDLELYEEIAKEEDVALAPNVLSNILEQPSLKIDQVHPNASGYKKIAEMIYESLKDEGLIF